MDPRDAALWIVQKHDEDPDEAPFDGINDAGILRMFYPLAKKFLALTSKHNPIREHGGGRTTSGNSEGI